MKSLSLTCTAFAFAFAGFAQADCIRFQDVAPMGPFFGGSYEVDANTLVSVVPSTFWRDPTTPLPTLKADMVKNDCQDGDAALRLNNTNITIHVMQREPVAQVITLAYCDQGGFENVSAAPTAPPEFIGEIDAAPPALRGPFPGSPPVDVRVSETPRPGGVSGELIFKQPEPPISVMVAGGQEFFAYAICVE